MDKYLNKITCGDCLEVMKEMPDGCVDLVLTDPPYGIKIGGDNGKIGGDKPFGNPTKFKPKVAAVVYGKQVWDNDLVSPETISEIIRVSKNQIIFGGNYYAQWLRNLPCWLVWDKDNSGYFADCELAWTSFQSAVRKFKWRWNGMLQQDMRNKEERIHPTQKPVKLGIWILKNYSKPTDIILDPFCGSGSFVIASAQLGRQYIGIDIAPEYVAIAQDRLKRETAQMRLM